MTRSEAIKAFFFKSVLPVIVALILYCIFKSACMKNGELDYVWLWILCGLPFGLHRMCLWIVPGGGSLGGFEDTIQDQCHGYGQYAFEEKCFDCFDSCHR